MRDGIVLKTVFLKFASLILKFFMPDMLVRQNEFRRVLFETFINLVKIIEFVLHDHHLEVYGNRVIKFRERNLTLVSIPSFDFSYRPHFGELNNSWLGWGLSFFC